MLARVAQRYAIAGAAFVVAAAWTGIGLAGGLECLFVFSLVYVASAAVQARRSAAGARSRRRRTAARREDGPGDALWPQRQSRAASGSRR